MRTRVIARMVAVGQGEPEALERRMSAGVDGAASFLRPDGVVDRAHAGLLYIESHRHLPPLAWPRRLIDTVVEVEQSMLAFRHAHARMVERMIGRRMGTGGSAGVDYLDATTKYRIFTELWAVRTMLVKETMFAAAARMRPSRLRRLRLTHASCGSMSMGMSSCSYS